MGRAEKVAKGVVFPVSDGASYLTGALIPDSLGPTYSRSSLK